MQLRDSYDLIVIGNQLSGLFLAAGAAQAGLRVLVLEEASVPTVLYEVPSGKLLGDFAAEPVIGLAADTTLDRFLQSLGLYQNIDEVFPFHDPGLQIVAPRLRLDFSYNAVSLEQQLRRELPLPRSQVDALARVLSGQVVSRGSFSDLIAKLELPVSYEAFGTMQAALYGSMAPSQISAPAYRDLMELGSRGVRFPIGGRSGLKERLLSRILVSGGTVKRATKVEEIVFERGRLTGVLLSSYEGFVRSPRVVGSLDAETFLNLIPNARRPKRLLDKVRAMRPRFWRLSFTLLVPEALLPEGMGSHVALINPEEGLEQENFLQLQIYRKDVYGGIPAGHVAVVARALMPFAEETIRARYIARVLKRSLQRIEDVMPFLRERPFSVSPDADKLEQDPVFQRYYRFTTLADVPDILRVYESGLSSSPDIPESIDWKEFGLEGLALCSRDIRPFHGLVGEIATAMDMLEKIKGEDRRRG
jgi:phytoene dehydrogenase-like protein